MTLPTDEPTVPAPGGPRRSPLHERHVGLGARLGDFGGWSMPLQYTGVVAEHTAVREAVGLFDVSHLGKAVVRGAGARALVDACLTNDLGRITAGRAQYTLCCEPDSGGVVDDLIVYLRDDDDLFLVPNAANAAEVVTRLVQAAPGQVDIEDRHAEYGLLAVQGPRCDDVLSALDLPCGHPYMSFVDTRWRGVPVTVCRTGYTGERGYELVVPAGSAAELWDTLLAAGEPAGLRPCGLGARDTLRTEMGYPLHGQELSADITPVQARAGWAVGWDKPAFWGREALLRERREGPRRTLRGLQALDRGIPRPHMAVSRGGERVGEVTSGTFSPTRRVGIGLALLAPDVAEGEEVAIDVRGRASACQVVKPPFVPSHTTA